MMLKYFLPTKVLLGSNCIKENAALLNSFGQKALLVTGKKSAKINGSQKDVEDALTTAKIGFAVYDNVESNPTVDNVMEGAEAARKEKVDFVIGIGGGSPLDAAKAIAILAKNEIDETELFKNNFKNPVLPIVAVPTTAGTGSEVTPYSIITDTKTQNKLNVSNEMIFPKIAFLDARYTDKLPKGTTINTAVDALSHAVEGYLSKRAVPISDMLAKEAARFLGQGLKELLEDSMSLELREKLIYASCLAGMVIAHTGSTILHPMGYPLTIFKNIDHGRANGLLMHEYLKFINQENQKRVGEILDSLGLQNLDELKILLDKLLNVREAVTEDEIKRFTSIAIKAKNMQNTLKQLSEKDMDNIYRESLK
ncbi:MAG: iron-containing alcohol dehydrogenase family protein [Deltaproteobacteria bacterium]